MFKRLLVISLSTCLLFPAAAFGSTEAFSFRGIGNPGETVFTITEEAAATVSGLAIQPAAVSGNDKRGEWRNCTSIRDPECEPSTRAEFKAEGESSVVGNAVLDFCRSKDQENCIESFEIANDGKNFKSANFLRNLRSNMSIPPDKPLGYPGGSTALIWDESNIDAGSKVKYLVSSSYGLGYWPGASKFEINNISFSITPFLEVLGDFRGPTIDPALPATNRITWGSDGRYFLNENGSAGIQIDFDAQKTFRLKVRVVNSIAGWFRGRLKDPVISIDRFSATNNVVTLQGEPVKVPTMGYIKKRSDLNAQENQWWQNNGQSDQTTPQSSNRGSIFEYIDYFRPKVGDKAIGSNTYWTIQSVTMGNDNNCLNDKSKVIGIVTTNSMGYEGGSPSFSDGTLSYKVAGMHFLPDGSTLATGTYDLVMRSEVARCLYGFSSAPVSASVSITGSDQTSIATTLVNEKDGWLKLAAYGFNFSNPVIKVRIAQQSQGMNKKSITCVKGKMTKKVTAVNLKCPAGYKKKP
jgi:hypothetical protein